MPGTLAALIAMDGRTPEQLAAASGIRVVWWERMAWPGPWHLTDGSPWRPPPDVVAAIAAALGVSECVVRGAIVTSSPERAVGSVDNP